MTADISQSTTKTFNYSFPTCTNEEVLFKLEVPVEIPYAGSTRELVQRVINMFHIPVYLQDELNENLATFVSEETKNFHNDRDQTLLDQLKSSEINVEGIIKGWEKAFKENVMEYAEQKGTSDEEVFAAAYHKLVHSPALETILQVENAYAKTVMNTLMDRDEDIRQLTQKQTEEMEEKVRLLNNNAATEMEINELATQQFEQQALVAGRWGSQLDAERQTQRALHRAWLMNTLEDLQSSSALHTPSNSPLGTFSPMTSVPAPLGPPGGSGARLEESFTIHLGSQLKQTHNIRLVTMDILDMCNVEDFDNPTDSWRRLQTSLGLYSAELSGAVLLTESPPRRPAPPTSGVIAAANRTTEHHFADVEHQLRDIAEKIAEPVERRNALRAGESAGVAGGAGGARRVRSVRGADPQAGDVFVTRHSNLPDLHAVFHLVVDESSLRSGDITSRHPAILGLRNILKAACSHDVTSLTIPLLLCHEIDDMTAGWCVRRAELVLKCAKGFMLEGAASRGAALRTLHVAAPRHTAPALFAQLAALLPDIFRQASPVKYKPPANSG